MTWNGMGGMMVFGIVMMVFGLVLIVGIVLLAAWVTARLWRRSEPQPVTAARGEDPLTILQRRYAGGEITKEDFERIRRDLQGTGQ
ncbi:MAG: SHOCT domain-containing protein [Candidatus Dormibacteraeota bacterium]|nr:SHOCT domain-containing protein [Candidatus Dormibacteraeota bacterium]